MAVTVLLEVKAQPDQGDALVQVFKEMIGGTRGYDGCQGAEVHRNQDDPAEIIWIELWETRQHYEKYLAWRQESGSLEAMGALLAGAPSIRYFDNTGA